MFLVPVFLCEDDAGGAFGGGGSVTRAVGTGLNDMHHAVFTWVTADIERVCSHQYPAHRLYPRNSYRFFFASYVSMVLVTMVHVVSPRW